MKDLVTGFAYTSITYYHDDWSISFFEQKKFRVGSTYNYQFTLTQKQEVFVGADLYVVRMYPDKCRGKSSGTVKLYKGSSTIGRSYISGSDGFGYVN